MKKTVTVRQLENHLFNLKEDTIGKDIEDMKLSLNMTLGDVMKLKGEDVEEHFVFYMGEKGKNKITLSSDTIRKFADDVVKAVKKKTRRKIKYTIALLVGNHMEIIFFNKLKEIGRADAKYSDVQAHKDNTIEELVKALDK